MGDALEKLDLTSRRSETLELISGSRSDLSAAFADLASNPSRYVWETRPFSKTPFLRLQGDGGLILMGRPWLHNWLGDGLYYRALDVARGLDASPAEGRTDHVQRYTQYCGHVFERYCLDRARAALPATVPVIGEQSYGKGGGSETSDVAVLWGRDLILFEVHGRRPASEPVITGDPIAVVEEIKKLLVKKVNQLGVTIGALIAGNARLPGVEFDQVRRVYPVVVTAGNLWQTTELWHHVNAARDPTKCASFADPRVQPVQVSEADDYEMLLALAHDGKDLAAQLRRKTSSRWLIRDLAAWLREDPAAPPAQVRLPFTIEVFEQLTASVKDRLTLT